MFHIYPYLSTYPPPRPKTGATSCLRIHVWYIYLHLVGLYGFHAGKYTSSMDPMGVDVFFFIRMTYSNPFFGGLTKIYRSELSMRLGGPNVSE